MSARPKIAAAGLVLGLAYALLRPLWVGAETRLAFLAVGQGDAVLFQHQGRTLLVDTGPKTDSFDAGERLVVPELKRLGVRQIDLLVLTHADYDHIGGTEAVLKVFPVKKIVTTSEVLQDPRLKFLHRLPSTQIVLIDYQAQATLGNAQIDLAVPQSSGQGREDNERSLALLIDVDGARIILTGDAYTPQEAQLSRLWPDPVQIAKAGHHGSKTSNSTEWLEHFRPLHLVASVGRNNPFGHPHPEAIARIEAVGPTFWRTDRDGTLTFTLKDGQFHPERQSP